MSPADLSLLALVVVILVSLTSRINIGVLAIALAAGVAILFAGWTPGQLAAEFPAGLFLTLAGVTLLFGTAQKNGTLTAITLRIVRLCGGRVALLPLSFFLLAGFVSSVGPGGIAATALVAPLAMAAGVRAGVPPFLIALMVANGANAGNLSPVSAVGIIVLTQMEAAGLVGYEWNVFLANFVAHVAVAIAAYLLFGGRQLMRAGRSEMPEAELAPFSGIHKVTTLVLAIWIVAVVFFDVDPGVSAFAAAAILIIGRCCSDKDAVSSVPWDAILMVSGVSVLIGVMDETGGLERFTDLLARIATPDTVNGTMAFVTGVISSYSSTSGVVYPAFLPLVPGLIQELGGGDPLQLALSINVGAALVDVSPLSTIGALALAALPKSAGDPAVLFRRMLLWGFAMTIVGAVFCQLLIGLFA